MFLQSPEWEAFQQSLGRKTWRVDEQLIIQHKLPLGFNYLYCPRPHINNADSFFAQAQRIALKEKAIFLKIDPATVISNIKHQTLNTNPLQPQKTIILDLSKSEEELLSAMHEKTRYNIRLAVKRGVEIKKDQNLEIFWDLLQETARRDGFHTHERQYYQKLFAVKSENFSNELFFAEYQGKILAAGLVNFYKAPYNKFETATYLHGASSRAHKGVMAPYFLQWHIAKTAKERGFCYYDFWGIDEEKWPGPTRFKKGFGGQIIKYPDSFDEVYGCARYLIYRFTRKVIY